MKKSLGLVSTAALLVAAGTASAQTAVRQFRGSDTLELFTRTLVAQCGTITDSGVPRYPALAGYALAPAPVGEFDYLGGGSTGGGTAMTGGTQDLAPQSRALSTAEACTTSIAAGPLGEDARTYTVGTTQAPGSEVEQWIAAFDGLSIVTKPATGDRCDVADPNADPTDVFGAGLAFNNTKNFPVPGGANYVVQDWRDVLRVLYAGADNTRAAANGGAAGQTAANRIERCNSAIRRALVANWDNLLQQSSCGAVANSCQSDLGATFPGAGGIRHALRRDDVSGTTDTFLTLLGLAGVGGNIRLDTLGVNEPFCNGKDNEDKDPIRIGGTTVNASPTTAAAANGGPDAAGANLNEETLGPVRALATQACSDSGLVQAVSVPLLIGTTNGPPSAANPTGPAGNRRSPTTAELYPTVNCIPGAFELRRPPRATELTRGSCPSTYGMPDCTVLPVGDPTLCWDPRCPDGQPLQFQDCLTPVATLSVDTNGNGQIDPGTAEDARGNAACLNGRLNFTQVAPVPPGGQRDGRIWNRFLRAAPPGTGPTDFSLATNPSPVLRNERGRDAQYAEFRMRARQRTMRSTPTSTNEFAYESVAGGSQPQTCRELDATRAIGCMSTAGECLIGFAGREAGSTTVLGAHAGRALMVGNEAGTLAMGPTACSPNAPDEPCPPGGGTTSNPLLDAIRQPAGSTSRYALSRKLYVNSIVGFDNFNAVGDVRWSDGPDTATQVRTQAPALPNPPGNSPDSYNEQAQLAACLVGGPAADGKDEVAVLTAIEASGFVSREREDGSNCVVSPGVPCTTASCPACAPGATACEEFDEALCLPAIVPTVVCANDAACGAGRLCGKTTPGAATGTCRDAAGFIAREDSCI